MTVMNDSFESDERKRKETIECLYWSLMNGWDIPKDIREHYGFSEDYGTGRLQGKKAQRRDT